MINLSNKQMVKTPSIFTGTPYLTGIDLQLEELLSYKQQAQLNLIAPASPSFRQQSGHYLAKIKGRGMEFCEVRKYQAGDDVRSIDWAVTARTGKAHTKLFQEEKERPVFILLDLSNSMIFGSQFVFKSVQAAHLCALLSWQSKKQNDRIGGIIFNQDQVAELKPSVRNKALLGFLYQSVSLCASSPKPLKGKQTETLLKQLKRLARLVQTGSQVHLISDFSQLDDDCLKVLNQIKRHNQISAWQVSDPLETYLPKHHKNGSIKIKSLTGTGFFKSKAEQERYQSNALLRLQKIANDFMLQGISLHPICAAKPLMEQFNVHA
jgi:uncharacterized protein (DUF58 family)